MGEQQQHTPTCCCRATGVQRRTTHDRHAATARAGPACRRRLRADGARLYPVGRLDQDKGLLVLTNDGELAERVLHPRPRHRAVRGWASTARSITARSRRCERHPVRRGLATLGGLQQVTGFDFEQLHRAVRPPPRPWSISGRRTTQGWKTRRMFERHRVTVAQLHRVRIGPVRIDGLPEAEVSDHLQGAGGPRSRGGRQPLQSITARVRGRG